jgi:thymidylate synthase ThyX
MTIKATIIADSINQNGIRLTTFEFEYPRFIHAEVMTHRMLSKNAASSRAIPIERMHEAIKADPGMPIYWGKNQSGMQAKEELDPVMLEQAKIWWGMAQSDAIDWSKDLAELGLHKQIANRITEPFQTMKTVISGTEWENFFWLRDHPDAQPEFQRLAASAKAAMDISIPMELSYGEWHLPYIQVRRPAGVVSYYTKDAEWSLVDARIISASCCAQVSYRKNDDTIDKARMIYDRLVNTSPVHASPVEHQATPMPNITGFTAWPQGVTHQRRDKSYWSGNFQDWIQFRQQIPNNTRW